MHARLIASQPLRQTCVVAARAQALLDETAAADALERQYCVPLDFAGANTMQARFLRARMGRRSVALLPLSRCFAFLTPIIIITIAGSQVRDALGKARLGSPLTGAELVAVVALQTCAGELRRSVCSAGAPVDAHGSAAAASWAPEVAPLRRLLSRVALVPGTADRIRAACDEDGTLRDNATPELAAARRRRATADARCRRALAGSGAPVVAVMDRLCLSLPQSAPLPQGALLLGSARGGEAAQLVEPAGVVALNNEREAAVAEERLADVAARTALTALIAAHIAEFEGQLQAVADVDAVAARARHAAALNAVRPTLVPHGRGVVLEALRHPLLVQRLEGAPWEASSRRVKTGAVVPIDVRVAPGVRCVLVSGPNTGGKTAAAKALALAALMARAGLFVPAERASLPWYDRVLVDIGDEQSLSLSLSTFSGRLARCHVMLRAATPRALVLLDELGAGTSPASGAAIGGALLQAFAAAASLTLATSHSGELKALKYRGLLRDDVAAQEGLDSESAPPPPAEDYSVYENAAAEFDAERLAPTYRLLWGVPGRSRALDIASRLGLDEAVVADARRRLGAEAQGVEDTVAALERARAAELADAAAARAAREQAKAHGAAIEAALQRLDAARAVLNRETAEEVGRAAAAAMAAVARRKAAAAVAGSGAGKARLNLAAMSAAAAVAAAAPPEPAGPYEPRVGDVVALRKLGGKTAVIAAVNGATLTVRAGNLAMTVAAADVDAAARGAPPPAPAGARGRKGGPAARWEVLGGRSKKP